MKRSLIYIVLLSLVLSLSGCSINNMEPEETHSFLNSIVKNIADCQITEDKMLMGIRNLTNEGDSYAGKYTSTINDVTGRDVVFGGGSIYTRLLHLSGRIETTSGEAKIRIRMNDEVIELKADTDGNFETELKFTSGGNYIMVVYDDFSGKVEMCCEYFEQDSIYLECNLEEYRLLKNLTQEQLAQMVDVQIETIIKIEKGRHVPSLKLATDISRAVEAPIEKVFVFE